MIVVLLHNVIVVESVFNREWLKFVGDVLSEKR